MAYKWKPSASQRRAFAERMKDPGEAAAYEQRKADRAEKRRAGSRFDYATAGGHYVPTKAQHDAGYSIVLNPASTAEQREAANVVIGGFSCNEKVHHDYIHVVNECIRSSSNL